MNYSDIISRLKESIGLVVCVDAQNKISSKGSGFVFFKKGIFVTCNHVITPLESAIKIKLDDAGEFIDAKVAIRDEEHDIAILKYDPKLASASDPIKQIETGKVKEGMAVVFAGYPLDLFNLTTHQGILSAIIKDPTGVTAYMIDGTVNPGNSGCPLLNDEGELVGVVNAKRRENSDLLNRVERMQSSAVGIYGIDIVKIYQAIINNLQMGMGYAIPCSYIPSYKTEDEAKPNNPVIPVENKKKGSKKTK